MQVTTIEVNTVLFDQDNYAHEITLKYEKLEPNIILEYGIKFIKEAKFEGFQFISEVVQELIEAIEGTRDLRYDSQLTIE